MLGFYLIHTYSVSVCNSTFKSTVAGPLKMQFLLNTTCFVIFEKKWICETKMVYTDFLISLLSE